jgi:hypothetical protein
VLKGIDSNRHASFPPTKMDGVVVSAVICWPPLSGFYVIMAPTDLTSQWCHCSVKWQNWATRSITHQDLMLIQHWLPSQLLLVLIYTLGSREASRVKWLAHQHAQRETECDPADIRTRNLPHWKHSATTPLLSHGYSWVHCIYFSCEFNCEKMNTKYVSTKCWCSC